MRRTWSLPLRPIRCRILTWADTVIDEEWAYGLRAPYWRLYRNQADGAVIFGKDWQYPLRSGRLHLVPAWLDCRSSCTGQVPHHFVHFEPLGLDGGWMSGGFTRPVILDPDPWYESEAESLSSARPSPGNHLRLQALVETCLARCLDGLDTGHRQALEHHLSGPDPVAAAIQAIEADPTAIHTVEGLARRCDLSPDHFGKVFRQRHGRTPHRWLMERRIALASEKLLSTDEDIDAIAAACGFANRFHFTRVFSRLTRVAPATYRRQAGWQAW